MENKIHELEVTSLFRDLQINVPKYVEELSKINNSKNFFVLSKLKFIYPLKEGNYESVSILRVIYNINQKMFSQEDDYYLEIYGFHETGEIVVSKYIDHLGSINPSIVGNFEVTSFNKVDLKKLIRDFIVSVLT